MPAFAATDLDDPVAHGAALGPRIRGHLDDWLETLSGHGVADPHAYVRELLDTTGFRAAVEELTPDLAQEVRDVAAGAEVDADLLLALQLIDEEPAHRTRSADLAKCTSLGIALPGGPTWIGQNMDLGVHTRGHQVLLRVAPRGDVPAALVFTVAGVVALMGVNAAGIGVCVNAVPQLPAARDGLPVAFVIRRLLQARTYDEAVRLVHDLPHATSQHYLLAAPGQVRSLEARPDGVAEHRPADPTRVLHTNHPLGPVTGRPAPAAAHRDSVARLTALGSRVATGSPSLTDLQDALRSSDDPAHPICRVRGAGPSDYTTGSMLSALHPTGAVESWVSPGPPSQTAYSHSLVRSGRSDR
ncbi:C45 family autoproteolytic acyltransferase/hydrolase [Pseudonocardia saturnea]